jgi:hypothetical protein
MKARFVLAAGALLACSPAQAATVFGVDGNDNLVSFNSASPETFTRSIRITGASGILGLDFRPINNVLYGLGSDRVIYTINTITGVATAVSGVLNLGPLSSQFAFDFNPTIDRLRIITNANNNFVFNPNDGSLTTATDVFYAAGDANQGQNPTINAVAYTSANFGDPVSASQLYGIDTDLDVLTRVANSAGTLNTVGSLGVDVGSRDSFDIAGNDAFAIDGRNFYRVNLNTGALSLIGRTDESLFGLSIATGGAVPEPATWALMILGFGAIGGAMRYRTRKVTFATA